MSTKRIPLLPGEFYHVFNRGNNKQEIFVDDKDREHFIKLLYICNSTSKINFREDIVKKRINAWDFERGGQLVAIGAWVLMPNHFHLFITPLEMPNLRGLANTTEAENNVALFMSRVCNAYSKYFNAKYKRTGSLFNGRFKSVHINNEIQAKYLFSYIHLNPIKLIQKDWKEKGISNKKKALEFLGNYKWSSYLDYLGEKRSENKIMDRSKFLDYFPTKKLFTKEIFDWIGCQTP